MPSSSITDCCDDKFVNPAMKTSVIIFNNLIYAPVRNRAIKEIEKG
jgi:hypothetical protein